MGIALFLIGVLAIIAGIVMFIIALIKKRGWGLLRAVVIGVVGFILMIVGIIVGITQDSSEPVTESIAPTNTEDSSETSTVNEIGKSRLNPVPYGTSLTYENQRVTVTGSNKVSEIGWTEANDSNIYLVVNVKVDFIGEQSEKKNYLSTISFRLVGNSGHIYDAEWYPETDNPLESGEFYGGATTSGDLVFEITEQETDTVLIWNCGFGVDRYLEVP